MITTDKSYHEVRLILLAGHIREFIHQIVYQWGYSSIAHLYTQFKKTIGLTPSYFKQIGHQKLKSLDQV